jgi:hypothetical protein
MSASIAALVKKQRVLIEGISDVANKVDALDADIFDLRTKKSLQEDEAKAMRQSLRETHYALIAIICPTLKDVEQFASAIHWYRKQLLESTPSGE